MYLAENEVVGADDEEVTVELSLDLLLDLVVHVGGVVGGQLVDDDLVGQLNLHATDGLTHAVIQESGVQLVFAGKHDTPYCIK